jgi:hypothetical protein
MPDPTTRHARTKWDWGQGPARADATRQAVRSDPEPARRAPARKDPGRCHGNCGGPHTPELRMSRYGYRRDLGCRWEPAWSRRDRRYDGVTWSCLHFEACGRCGKILADQVGEARCPDYPGDAVQRFSALHDGEERNGRITEPSPRRRRWEVRGYRKPKKTV